MKNIKGFTKYFEKIITQDMLFENNVKEIIKKIEIDYNHDIQHDFDTEPSKYENLITWLELHPEIVGKAFMSHIINYGFTEDDIRESLVTENQFNTNRGYSIKVVDNSMVDDIAEELEIKGCQIKQVHPYGVIKFNYDGNIDNLKTDDILSIEVDKINTILEK